MIPTPNLSHLTSEDYEYIYEPAEDTFILLDALEEDADHLRSIQPRICLEIGSGSGIESVYLATDINPHACRATEATGAQNHVSIEPLLAPLAGPLRTRLERAVDILLFNPPYVPTESDEALVAQQNADISSAWAGGYDGMTVTDMLLDQVESLLSPQGRFYLVAVKQNDIKGICKRMLAQHGLRGEVALQRRAGREHLYVLRFFRSPSET